METKTSIVDATFEILFVQKKVLVRYPRANEEVMPYVKRHEFVNNLGEKIEVKSHFKMTDYYNKQAVIRNFYVYPGLRGKMIVVDVKIIKKIDNYRKKTTLIIDISGGLDADKLTPRSKLSIGCPSGRFQIPGAPGKFIDFKPMKK